MNIDLGYFHSVQGTNGLHSSKEYTIRQSQAKLKNDIPSTIGYEASAARNGVAQPLVLIGGKTPNKAKVITLPNDELFAGDIISAGMENWIIVSVSQTNPIQKVGEAWLCNQKFRFQNGTSTIIEKYGVLDNGSYSISDDKQVGVLSDKYKVYLPYDDETKKLYIDKRIATNVSYNKDGKQMLTTYKITGYDPVSKSYGQGAHLLVMPVESSPYDPVNDNITEMICDYIISSGGGDVPSPTLLNSSISGRSTIRTGYSNTYNAVFYKADGVTVDENIVATWNVVPNINGVTIVANGNSIKISAANNDALIGEVITITLTDTGGLYNSATITVEVI